MNNDISNVRKSKLIIVLCIFGILILCIYQEHNKNSARLYLDMIENSDIDNIMIVIDKYYDRKIKLENIELIDQFKDNLTKFEWSLANQKSFNADGDTLYNFELYTEDGICNIFFVGKNYVLIDCFDRNQLDYKYINLEVSWDEESYNRIVELVNDSRELE